MKYCEKYDMYFSKNGLAFYYDAKKDKLVESKTFVAPNGYTRLLYKCKITNLSRAVYEAFNGVLDDGLEVDHIDGCKSNNDISNLRAVSHSENLRNPVTVAVLSAKTKAAFARPEVKAKHHESMLGKVPWNKGKCVKEHYNNKPGPKAGTKWKLVDGKRVYFKEDVCK